MSAPVSLQIFVGFFMFAIVFIPLERFFPGHALNIFRQGYRENIFYYVLGCFVSKFTDLSSRLVALVMIRHLVAGESGTMVAHQPQWIQFLEILLIADFLAYVFHRWLHKNEILWSFHRVHHSETSMDWLSNVRLHPIDKILGDCFQFIPIFFLGFSEAPLLTYTIFLGFQGFLNHSNIRVDYGPLRWVIASPEFHHWHHCKDSEFYNKNFAPHLVIFDLLFGTLYLPSERCLPERYGVLETMPEGFWEQMLYPFRQQLQTRTLTDQAE